MQTREFKKLECQYRLIFIENKETISYYKTNGMYLAEEGSDFYIKLGGDVTFLKNYVKEE